MLRKALLLSLGLVSVGLYAESVLGVSYPTKPIELVCPYTTGGPTDALARLLADITSKSLGQPIVVVNKPGAGGTQAAADAINSKPDGYKLVILTNMYFATTTKTQKLPFDPHTLVPIASFMEYRLGLIVKGDSNWKSLSDLVEYGKENPGKLRWSHTGRGIIMHMQGLLTFRQYHLDTIDVPYKGNAESVAALLGGHVDAAVMSYGTVKDLVKAGKIRYLVFFGNERIKDEPSVPTSAELGIPDAGNLTASVGVYVHEDTDPAVRKTLVEAFRKTYEGPELKKMIEQLGEEPRFLGPEAVRDSIKKGEDIGIPIIKELGLYVGQ